MRTDAVQPVDALWRMMDGMEAPKERVLVHPSMGPVGEELREGASQYDLEGKRPIRRPKRSARRFLKQDCQLQMDARPECGQASRDEHIRREVDHVRQQIVLRAIPIRIARHEALKQSHVGHQREVDQDHRFRRGSTFEQFVGNGDSGDKGRRKNELAREIARRIQLESAAFHRQPYPFFRESLISLRGTDPAAFACRAYRSDAAVAPLQNRSIGDT